MHQKELRIALRNVGKIAPDSLEDYKKAGGYAALAKARGMEQEALIGEIEKSGKLRGRGGAGFNTGLKWRGAWKAQADQKYIVCNADEGEPGTYKDRIIMENDPHTIVEGILIGAYAIGATKAYIYCRGEYQTSIRALTNAVAQAEADGLTGGVTISLVSGAGSYVCGEETALLDSIEGKRGEPRLKPPYPTEKGLCGKPTVINNVETFAAIPVIVEKGAQWFSSIGAPGYPGTKIISLSGDVVNRTYFEVPTNLTVREIVYDLGGGIPDGKKLKAVQFGGTTCAFMTEEMLDTPMDFDSMRSAGASLGSGAVLVIDETHNMADVLYPIVDFLAHESCGKCLPCREGGTRAAELVKALRDGKGSRQTAAELERLVNNIQKSCFCPLGQSYAVPVNSALKHFESDFAARLVEGGV